MTKYTIERTKLARSPLATGPGVAWRWLYSIKRGDAVVANGFDLLASAQSWIRRKAIGPYYVVKAWA